MCNLSLGVIWIDGHSWSPELGELEENSSKMKIVVEYERKYFDLSQVSEVMGSEIACYDENGWIQRFSEIGRFVI